MGRAPLAVNSSELVRAGGWWAVCSSKMEMLTLGKLLSVTDQGGLGSSQDAWEMSVILRHPMSLAFVYLNFRGCQ